MPTLSISTGSHRFTLSGYDERVIASMTAESLQPGVDLIRIALAAETPIDFPPVSIHWSLPARDIHASWHPAQDRNKSFKADWMRDLRSNAAASAPVYSLFNAVSRNRMTFAFSEALHTVHYAGAVREETGEFQCAVKLFQEPGAPLQAYEGCLLVDTREDVFYYESLRLVQDWWGAMPEYAPSVVPDSARRPMYSTWYNMHQEVSAEALEAECRIAKSLGMDAVIVDDGWQTEDTRRGYAYTGDWIPFEGKFPDMRQHVKAAHQLGMSFILWYSVPFVGKHSQAWELFKNKLLRYNENHGAGVLDPRYPEVREYIIAKYEQAVIDWDLDGFKLDFVDQFYSPERQSPSYTPGRDYESIPEAVDRLLTDSICRLRRMKPDIMVEFRQPYIGPAMRKYGNMFRAGDCPNDSIQNRVRTLDLRLICGSTAAHADMIMWNPEDPVPSAALQLINLLFSVPQVSVLLEKLSDEHARMLRYWLAFWQENRDVLLDGELAPMNPELLYPVVRASNGVKTIIVTYHDAILTVPVPSNLARIVIVNGRLHEGLYLDIAKPIGKAHIEVKNALGDTVCAFSKDLEAGIFRLPIPAAGTAEIVIYG